MLAVMLSLLLASGVHAQTANCIEITSWFTDMGNNEFGPCDASTRTCILSNGFCGGYQSLPNLLSEGSTSQLASVTVPWTVKLDPFDRTKSKECKPPKTAADCWKDIKDIDPLKAAYGFYYWNWGYVTIPQSSLTIDSLYGKNAPAQIKFTRDTALNNVKVPKCRVFEFRGKGSTLQNVEIDISECALFFVATDPVPQFHGDDGTAIRYSGPDGAAEATIKNVKITGTDEVTSPTLGIGIANDEYAATNATGFTATGVEFVNVGVSALLWDVFGDSIAINSVSGDKLVVVYRNAYPTGKFTDISVTYKAKTASSTKPGSDVLLYNMTDLTPFPHQNHAEQGERLPYDTNIRSNDGHLSVALDVVGIAIPILLLLFLIIEGILYMKKVVSLTGNIYVDPEDDDHFHRSVTKDESVELQTVKHDTSLRNRWGPTPS